MFLLVTAFIGIALFEVPVLIKKKYWRELFVFSVLMLVAFIFAALPIIGVKVPTFLSLIEYLIIDILRLDFYV
jgi:hypothetical protein